VKILIVDDDPNSLRLLSVNLRFAGHEAVEALDGAAAWELFQGERQRMVVTDWMMPVMDGMDLIRRIREVDHAGYTYIIMVTALATKPQVVSGLVGGADDYLTKPFDHEELLARVTIGERILKLEEDLRAAKRTAETLAMHDTLTGLFNRRAIRDRALAELNRLARDHTSGPLSVILLDVDRFKIINDSYGHDAGDRALRLVAGLLAEHLRNYDVVGRWGGEEFLLLLPGASVAEAKAAAERIRERLADTDLGLNGGGSAVTASFGVATVTPETVRPGGTGGEQWLDRLVRAADRALYQAKGKGRNQVVVAPTVDES
jgi:two-component system chemotaxis response regulator CheY